MYCENKSKYFKTNLTFDLFISNDITNEKNV